MPPVPFDVTPAAWAELDRLLDQVLDLPPAERGRWLDGLGLAHPETAGRLRDLLRAEPAGGPDRWSLPPLDSGAEETPGRTGAADDRAPGDRVGPYRLVSLLGQGGMGTVWLAERADGMVRRPIALKLPRAAGPRSALAARLAREREILAALAHPNIARLYDAGLAEDGQPFLALEHVEGRTIDRFAREERLDLPARLRLFVQVARAVAHAHGRLVVHRDLKPSNVLVTAEGQAKLLDFGIAKLLEPDRTAPTTELTEASGRVLTVAYASPEQISGEPIGVASDVYALGVLLHELLAGTRPHRAEGRRALEHAVLHDEPPRASEGASDPALRRALRGDLDAILARALRKLPEARYSTADAFADDLERYLAGRPVRARQGGAGYRLRKLVARHRVAVAASAVAVVAILGGAGAAAWQARVARAEQRRAEEVKRFITSIFTEADPFRSGRPLAVVDLLEKAEARVDTELRERPDLRVELRVLLARGLYDLQREEAADRIARAAVEEGTRTLGPLHPETLRARVFMNVLHRARGRNDAIRADLDGLITALRAAGPPLLDDLNLSIRQRANVAIADGKYPEAIAAAEEALRLALARGGERDPLAAPSAILVSHAHGYASEGEAALRTAEDALRMAKASSPEPRSPWVLEARNALARARRLTGDGPGAARALAELALDMEQVHGARSAPLAFVLDSLAREQLDLGENAEAIANATRAAEILTAPPDLEKGSYAHAGYVRGRGLALLGARRDAEALPDLDLVANAFRAKLGPTHSRTVPALVQRALALARLGRFAEADADLAAALAVADRPSPYRALYVQGIRRRLAGDLDGALRAQEAALAATAGKDRRGFQRMVVLTELGTLAVERGAPAEAAAPLEEALALYTKLEPRPSPDQIDARLALGRMHLAQGQPALALAPLEEAEAYWRQLAPEGRWAGEAALWLGRALQAQGRSAEARTLLARASALLAQSPLPGDGRLAVARPGPVVLQPRARLP